VNAKGALLFVGDGHPPWVTARSAHSHRSALRVRLQVSVIKGQKIAWPRFENDEYIMTVGAYRPLDDALRIAIRSSSMDEPRLPDIADGCV